MHLVINYKWIKLRLTSTLCVKCHSKISLFSFLHGAGLHCTFLVVKTLGSTSINGLGDGKQQLLFMIFVCFFVCLFFVKSIDFNIVFSGTSVNSKMKSKFLNSFSFQTLDQWRPCNYDHCPANKIAEVKSCSDSLA